MKRALVVLSGGQDSTTCLAQAIQTYGRDNVHAVTFNYGQRHHVEIESARMIAIMAGLAHEADSPSVERHSLRHEIIDVPGILKGTSPLVSGAEVESYQSADVLPGGLEKTFVPMRNQLFFTLAANRAVLLGMEKGCDVDIITGVSQEDYGGYPDCRTAFVKSLERTVGFSLDDPELPHIYIETPLMFLNKRQTVEMSEATPGARALLAYSHTCYNGSVPPCGHCHACLLREKGYSEAGVTDPLVERLKNEPPPAPKPAAASAAPRRFIG